MRCVQLIYEGEGALAPSCTASEGLGPRPPRGTPLGFSAHPKLSSDPLRNPYRTLRSVTKTYMLMSCSARGLWATCMLHGMQSFACFRMANSSSYPPSRHCVCVCVYVGFKQQ